jgi:hypothetical protein
MERPAGGHPINELSSPPMPATKEFTWSADNTFPARFLRFLFPRSPWRYRRILGVHRFYKKFNMRFRNLPVAMPSDFHLTYHTSRTARDKYKVSHYEITATKCTARTSEQTAQQRRDKQPVQWTEKYSDLDRDDVVELYEIMRKTGCIFFDTEKGMEVSFDHFYTTSIVLDVNGRQYHFGESTTEPYYTHWNDESGELYTAIHLLLVKYKLEELKASKAVPEE